MTTHKNGEDQTAKVRQHSVSNDIWTYMQPTVKLYGINIQIDKD